MKSFPVFLRLDGQRSVVIGGGEAAAQKVRLLRRTETAITVMAPELVPELAEQVERGTLAHVPAVLDAEALAGARLVMVATGCAGADGAAAALARAQGALVNVVDRPDFCDVTTPALVDRDPLVVAIGTEGAAPVLARQIKTRLEAMLEPSLGAFTAMAGALRPKVAFRVAPQRRRAFWEWMFGPPRRLYAEGREAEAEAMIAEAVAAGGPPGDALVGRVALVDAGPGPADLLTLRAVQRLQTADVIFHGELRDPKLLELPRRDAERIALAPGQDPTAALIEAAGNGGSAVLLTHGAADVDRPRLEAAGTAVEEIAGLPGPAARREPVPQP